MTEDALRTHAAGSLASLDGEILPAAAATIPVTDEGLIRGDGVFEVVRIYDGRPFKLEEHLERLERSAANIRLPLDVEAVRSDAYRLLAQAGVGPDHGQLRIILTRGGRRLLMTEPLHRTPEHVRLATITYSPTRILDGIKSLSYAANMLATRLAVERGFDDALLVTPHGRVLEAPTSSFFWVRDGELLTPPLDDHILASITRRLVLEVGGGRERACTLEDLDRAEEAFLASTTREVQPVIAIDERAYPADGPVTARLAERVAERVRAELEA
ncbi:MAG TPA: aminotransferase class IV [Solirubrobacteraceae bacterium]|nr:aminotransferase class IV [Solirubrobacteraceae bacterium]